MAYNVLLLGDVADFQHQTITNIYKFLIKRQSFEIKPKPRNIAKQLLAVRFYTCFTDSKINIPRNVIRFQTRNH
jgi:hypothetical protein